MSDTFVALNVASLLIVLTTRSKLVAGVKDISEITLAAGLLRSGAASKIMLDNVNGPAGEATVPESANTSVCLSSRPINAVPTS